MVPLIDQRSRYQHQAVTSNGDFTRFNAFYVVQILSVHDLIENTGYWVKFAVLSRFLQLKVMTSGRYRGEKLWWSEEIYCVFRYHTGLIQLPDSWKFYVSVRSLRFSVGR